MSFRRIAQVPSSLRRHPGAVSALAAAVLAGVLAVAGIHVANRYAHGRIDAARTLLQTEGAADDQFVALYMYDNDTITPSTFEQRVDAAHQAAEHDIASLHRLAPDAADRMATRLAQFESAFHDAVAMERSHQEDQAVIAEQELAALRTRMDADVEQMRAGLVAQADAATVGTEITTGVLVALSLLVVAWTVLRYAGRQRRLAVVEAESAALRRSEESLRLLFDSSPQPMFVFDAASLRLLAVNETAAAFYGRSRDELLGMTVVDLNAPDGQDDVRRRVAEVQRAGSNGLQVRHRIADGRDVDVQVHSRLVTYAGRQAKLTLVVDVSERATLEKQLRHQAFHDSLTGLANRALFLDRLEHAMARRDDDHAVVLLDLDGFKTVNDSLGHVAGDALLVAVGSRLAAALRGGDTVARLGGDEFAVLLESVGEGQGVGVTCERLLESLAEPFSIGDRLLTINASIGVAFAGDEGSAEAVLARADTAMYVAKASGKGQYRVFDPAMHDRAVDRLGLEQDLRHAIELGQLHLLYQPKVDAESGLVTAVEALVRWQHPTRGLVAPDQFIPVAEEAGLIAGIDSWVMETACAQAAAWIAAGTPLQHVAVNISGRELEAGDLTERVGDVLRRTGLPAACLEIELTETTAVHQTGAALQEMRRLRSLGVRIAIDDFGTGYSMLSRLKDFPVDALKIDRSFVRDIAPDGNAPLVSAMIAMGHELGLTVVAEGVETREQLGFLRGSGCDQLQGYLLGRPLEAATVATMLGAVAPSARTAESSVDTALQAAADAVAARSDADHLVDTLLAEVQRLTGLESLYLTRIDERRNVQEMVRVYGVDATSMPGAAPIETFVGVPVYDQHGRVAGTLCAASSRRVDVGDTVLDAMRVFARLMAPATTSPLPT